ncbi:helix-turn-helix domain-containing protein [Streptomyces sp. 3214.6]|uniref:helix-turn-helix domain-containing protein n=1 Tax=Streptomyces sp. 3214.6 TaxID=1882757 RepID=UPI0009A7E21A|nr:helix-turn-helix domain-containing protein [Streptomyces sp. 3214.6]
MPKILKVVLSSQERAELRIWLQRRDLPRFERLRLDAVRLLNRGMTAPQAAEVLECDVTTVRRVVHRLEEGGLAALAELLHREGFRWKRTRDSLRHKADPALQQAARAQLEGARLHGWRPPRAHAI